MSVAIGDCAREGRKAFEQLGVTGVTAQSYPEGSVQRVAFVSGFSDAQHQASERALSDASAYHALCVRDAALDRAWAEKLSKARGL